ncbi:MAG: hypothetical protein CMO55_26290 [Verrucomicrobiales bacterium]|nr:hypothetical protein [Verrucomicrobiales bacterium]
MLLLLMRPFLPIIVALCAAFPLSVFSGNYTGAVGNLDAKFSIDWHDDGTVSGEYSYPSRPGTTYRLTGNNHTEGKLYLEEYTGGTLTARCYLSKVLSGSVITWKGEMQNTDGRSFPMSFSRKREESNPSQNWNPNLTGTAYRGNVGKLTAVFFLHWNDDSSVHGSYYYPAREGTVYKLTGSNPRDGELYLTEFTGNEVTAKCVLTKKLTDGNVIWEGTMNNTDGRQFPMTLRRDRSTDSSSTMTSNQVTPQRSKLPQSISWNSFPKSDMPVEMVPIALEGESFVHAVVTHFQSTPNGLSISMDLGEIDWESDGPDRFQKTGESMTLKMARHVPIPANEIVGRQLYLQIDESGELFSVYFCGIVLTHVRKGPSEKVEVRGIVNEEILASEDPDNLRNMTADFVSFVPDKVALRLNSPYGYEPYVQTLRLVRDYGTAIQSDSAGPGMLELESISIEPPADTNPWYYIGDKNIPLSVPVSQRTNEAG